MGGACSGGDHGRNRCSHRCTSPAPGRGRVHPLRADRCDRFARRDYRRARSLGPAATLTVNPEDEPTAEVPIIRPSARASPLPYARPKRGRRAFALLTMLVVLGVTATAAALLRHGPPPAPSTPLPPAPVLAHAPTTTPAASSTTSTPTSVVSVTGPPIFAPIASAPSETNAPRVSTASVPSPATVGTPVRTPAPTTAEPTTALPPTTPSTDPVPTVPPA